MYGTRRPHVGPMVMRCTWVGGGADPVVVERYGDHWGSAPVYSGVAGGAYVPVSLPDGWTAVPVVSAVETGDALAAYYDPDNARVVVTCWETDDPGTGNPGAFVLVVHVLQIGEDTA